WTLWRQSADVLDTLEKGAFVLMVGTSNLDLNSSGSQDAYYELLQMQVTPQLDAFGHPTNDSSQYTYKIMARGVNNTAPGTYNPTTTNWGGVDGYVIVSGSNSAETLTPAEARDFTLTGFGPLHDNVIIDQWPS